MASRICLGLSEGEREELERFYRRAKDGAVKVRSLMIRLLDRGETLREIGHSLGVSRVTIWRWRHRYLLEGLGGLYTRSRKGRLPKLRAEAKELLIQAIESDPRSLGINASNWTSGLLAYYLERKTGVKLTDETVRCFLHRAGFKLKRPSAVVISPDPQYEEKRGSLRSWFPTIGKGN